MMSEASDTIATERSGLDQRFLASDERMTRIEKQIQSVLEVVETAAESHAASIQHLSRQMQANTDVTQDIKDIVDTGKALFKFGGWIGAFVRWVTPLAAAVAVGWAVVSGKHPPPP